MPQPTPSRSGKRRRLAVVLPAIALATTAAFGGAAWSETVGPSGLPVPRFVSLKSDPVNLRKGPGRQYPKAWIFRRAGLPVEVVQEFEHWRRVRDAEGAEGWVYHALLSGRRTALIQPWEARKGADAALTDLRTAARTGAAPIARLEAGTLTSVKSCTKSWCRVTAGQFTGYVQKHELWGVYPDEVIR